MKHRRLFIFASLMMTFALSACSNPFLPNLPTSRNDVNSNNSGNGDYSSNEHSHSWGEGVVTKEATCEEKGQKVYTCACGETKTEDIKALGHKWVADPAKLSEEATCEHGGVKHEKCSVCGKTQAKSIPAKGHTWGSWTNIEQPTCEEPGSRKHYCTICGQDEVCEIAALGHNYSLYDYSSPEEGKAEVRLYKCANGCGSASLTFNVSEVTSHSDGLVYESPYSNEVGARFWGRPIGNKMELGEDGSAFARPDDLAAIYDPTVYGDCFEYTFDLTAKQVAAMGETCLLYCDAQPADYMGMNQLDFWARNPGDEEWTPGFYIEGDKAGQVIEDYRYILYVDDAPVEFDPSIKSPVYSQSSGWFGSSQRGEFVMPYKFHLHTGENKISLRMAGGYRSLFYNFTFRAVEAEEPQEPAHTHTWGDAQKMAAGEGQVAYDLFTCASCGLLKADVKALDGTFVSGSTIKSGTPEGFIKLASNGDAVTWKINVPGTSSLAGTLYQRGFMDAFSSNAAKTYANTSSSGDVKDYTTGNFDVTVNGVSVDKSAMMNVTFEEMTKGGADSSALGNNYSPIADCQIGAIELQPGENVITYKRLASYNLVISDIIFLGKAHTHVAASEWSKDENQHWHACTADGCPVDDLRLDAAAHTFGEAYDFFPATCTAEGSYKVRCTVCGYKKDVVIPAGHKWGDAQTAVGDAEPHECSGCHTVAYDLAVASPVKLKADLNWNITGLPAGEYEIQLYACVASTTFTQPYNNRYQFKVDSGDYIGAFDNDATYASYGLGTGEILENCQWSKPINTIAIGEGAAQFTIHWTDKGYSAFIAGVRLVKVA